MSRVLCIKIVIPKQYVRTYKLAYEVGAQDSPQTSRKGNLLDFIKISSEVGRSHNLSLFTNKDGSQIKIHYIDKERTQNWLNANRLQLPLRSFSLDSNYSITNP